MGLERVRPECIPQKKSKSGGHWVIPLCVGHVAIISWSPPGRSRSSSQPIKVQYKFNSTTCHAPGYFYLRVFDERKQGVTAWTRMKQKEQVIPRQHWRQSAVPEAPAAIALGIHSHHDGLVLQPNTVAREIRHQCPSHVDPTYQGHHKKKKAVRVRQVESGPQPVRGVTPSSQLVDLATACSSVSNHGDICKSLTFVVGLFASKVARLDTMQAVFDASSRPLSIAHPLRVGPALCPFCSPFLP